jgi:ABC-type transporter Mla maintaining outer membrane lipid asymmetry ATPase subunit MlaF
MESAFVLATRMAFLDGGVIVFDGTPGEARESQIPIITEFLSASSVKKK